MAERTGVAELDAALAAFIAADPLVPLSEYDEYGLAEDARLSELGDIEQGVCLAVSETFGAWLRERLPGTDARVHTVWHPWNLDEIGYADRVRESGFDAHSLVKVASDGDYLIDFVAGQYGYSEFPLVQKLDDDGITWLRSW